MQFLPPSAGAALPEHDLPKRTDKRQRQLPAHYYTLDAHHRTAVELSNIGADLIDAKEYLLAIETLRDSVALLSKPVVQINAGDDEALYEYSRSNNDAIARAESKLFKINLNVVDGSGGKSNERIRGACDDGALLVYSEPVRLSSPPRGGGLVVEEAAAAVLFNLALAHHLTGSCNSSPQRQQTLLNKALVFYEMCVSTMLGVGSTEGCRTIIDGGIPGLARAVINNAGQIYLCSGDHRQGRKYFHDLKSLCQGEDGSSEVVTAKGMDLFSFNVFVADQMIAAPMA